MNVISLKEMTDQARKGSIKKNSIAITFDDGYADNYITAIPLLQQYNLPATFFITSCNIGKQLEFWWDELENIFLFTNLPQEFSCTINEKLIEFNLQNETILTKNLGLIHREWKACTEPPPTLRCKLFYKIWEVLKPLSYKEQQNVLQHIKHWAGINYTIRNEYTCMSEQQLQNLSSNNLFSVAVHTSNHPALAYHDYSFQKKEITDNKKILEKITNQEINCLSYPYGNYNNLTLDVVNDSGFKIAFTTEEKPVTKYSNWLRLGRYQVKNLNNVAFEEQIIKWIND